MKRNLKKLFSLMLAATMLLAMSATAFADTVKVTIPDEELQKHNFVAYQILSGKQAEGATILTDVEWGTGINSDAFLSALKANEKIRDKFVNVHDAPAFAKAMNNIPDYSDEAKSIAQIAYKCISGKQTQLVTDSTELDSGYYLIVDETGNLEEGDAYNPALLQVTRDITINNKTDKPTVEKKVQENVKPVEPDENKGDYGEGYNDVADYNIGDQVPFKLIGTVPDTSNYETYKTYTFVDTLSKGLTLPANDEISVYYATSKAASADNKDVTNLIEYFNVTTGTNPQGEPEIRVALKEGVDLKDVINDKNLDTKGFIIVSYSATLNAEAEIGLPGNTNSVHLEYTNNPNHEEEGKPGTTPEDKVIVFTYELDVTKVDGEDKVTPLQDAEFVLLNADCSRVAILDENNKVVRWEDVASLTKENDKTIWPEASVLSSNDSGFFNVIGLDDGTYYLKETKPPAGYNLLKDPVNIQIKATTKNDQNWNTIEPGLALTELEYNVIDMDGSITATDKGDINSGIVKIAVENNKGAELPSTGGVGTTLFYIFGAILVLGAGVVLITRRRMSH